MWDFYIDQQKDELKDSIARNRFAEFTWSTEILKMEMFLKVLKLLKHISLVKIRTDPFHGKGDGMKIQINLHAVTPTNNVYKHSSMIIS